MFQVFHFHQNRIHIQGLNIKDFFQELPSCIRSQLRLQLTPTGQLRCPDDECKNTISPDILQRLLGFEQYERWERLMVQKTLEQMGDVVWCPRCSNPVVRVRSIITLSQKFFIVFGEAC